MRCYEEADRKFTDLQCGFRSNEATVLELRARHIQCRPRADEHRPRLLRDCRRVHPVIEVRMRYEQRIQLTYAVYLTHSALFKRGFDTAFIRLRSAKDEV